MRGRAPRASPGQDTAPRVPWDDPGAWRAAAVVGPGPVPFPGPALEDGGPERRSAGAAAAPGGGGAADTGWGGLGGPAGARHAQYLGRRF